MTIDTQAQIAKFIDSQQMENLETQERVINLGKQLAEELKLNSISDTLSHWMVNYISEQIVNAESTTGAEKIEAEQKCFETILKLWEYRASFPNGGYPFKDLEPIFRVLHRLDPENLTPFYEAYWQSEFSSMSNGTKNIPEGIQSWIDLAQKIDHTARMLIEFAFFNAAVTIENEKVLAWVQNAENLKNSSDVQLAAFLICFKLFNVESGKNSQEWVSQLLSEIEELPTLTELRQTIESVYNHRHKDDNNG